MTDHRDISDVRRHTAWSLLAQLLVNAAMILQAVIIARTLGAEQYGTLVLTVAAAGLANGILNWRVWLTIAKFVPEYRANERPEAAAAVLKLCFKVELVSGLCAVLVTVMAASQIAGFIPQAVPQQIVLAAVLPLLHAAAEPCRALFRLAGAYRLITADALVHSVTQTLMVAIAALSGAGVTGFLLAMALAAGVRMLGLVGLSVRVYPQLGLPVFFRVKAGVLRKDARRVRRFLLLSNLTATASLMDRLDCVLLAVFLNPADVGNYELAKKFVQHGERLFQPLHRAVFYRMSKAMAVHDLRRVRRLVSQAFVLILAIVAPVAVVVSLAATPLMVFAFGGSFVPAGSAVSILIWRLLRHPFDWIRCYLLCTDRAGLTTALKWGLSVGNLAVLAVVVPSFGLTGACLVNIFCIAMWIATAVVMVSRSELFRKQLSGSEEDVFQLAA